MKIEIWLDYVCPFSYMVKRRFETALDSFKYKDQIEIILRSFELTPNVNPPKGKSQHEVAAEEMGKSVEEAKQSNIKLTSIAHKEGLDYNFDTMIPANTHDAHRLTHYAASQGKAYLLCERIFKAHFTDSLDINDHKTLALLAEEIGLDQREALKVLESNQYSDSVKEDEKNSNMIGLDVVPFFLFDGKFSISGDKPVSSFEDALNRALSQSSN